MRSPWAFWRVSALIVIAPTALVGGVMSVIDTFAAGQVAFQPSLNQPASAPTSSVPAVVTPPSPATPQPAVAPPPAPDHSAKVQSVLDSWAASHASQQWSVVVQGLGSDVTKASFKPDVSFRSASIYKIFVTYPMFQTYSLDALSTNYVTAEGRGSVTLKTCVDLMIKASDNPCGEAVASKVGWAKATTALKQLGMASTNLSTSDYSPLTTAHDTALFLQKLNDGQLYDSAKTSYIVGLMQVQKNRRGIPTGCAGCTVADKNGDLSSVRHDAGIVKHAGGSYVLSVFTNGASYAQIAELTKQVQAAMSS